MERHVNPEDPDLYALGAIEGEEKQALEAHVRGCPACAAELEAARQRVTLMGLAAPPATPAPRVKDALLRRVRQERAGAIAVGPAPAVRIPPARRPFAWLTPVMAAATVFFAVLAGWLWTRNEQYTQQISALRTQLAGMQTQSQEIARTSAETDHLLGMPGTIRVAMKAQLGAPAGRGGVLYNASMGMVMCAGQLAPPPAGKSYQLWLVPMQGKPMSLGVFSSTGPGMAMMAHVPPNLEAKAFAVTLEPFGGMPQPTGPMVLVGAAG